MFNQVKNVVVRFSRDDRGMEAVQIIMTLAIAAMVCLGVAKVSGVDSNGASGTGIIGTIVDKAGGFLGDAVKSALGIGNKS